MRDCEKCGLFKTAITKGIGLDGGEDAEVLFIGEAPGAKEDDKGLPFQGKSGTLLRNTIQEYNVQHPAFTNVVQCRPPGNRNPLGKEIKICSSDLYSDISKLPKLRLIVACGNIALRGLLGIQGISKLSGTVLDKTWHEFPIMALYHPSYILREPQKGKEWREHMGRVKEYLDGTLVKKSDIGKYLVIKSIDEVEKLYSKIRERGYFAYDIETSGFRIFQDNNIIKCVGFSLDPWTATVLPTVPTYWTYKEFVGVVLPFLEKVFKARRIGKIGHNIKFDNLFIRQIYGIKVQGTIWDTMISQFVLDETAPQGLKDMAWKYTQLGGYEKALSVPVQDAEGEELYTYNAIDCDITNRIFQIHKSQIEENPKFSKLIETLLIPVNDVLADMEYNGMLIDKERVKIAGSKIVEERDKIVEKLYNEPCIREFEVSNPNERFNPNSHTQLREILFRHAGLEPKHLTSKTKQPSTRREALEELAREGSHTCELLIEYANYNALEKFTKALIEYADVNDIIHTQYRVTRASSGRTSSSDPNLQNIPNKSKDLVGIRKCFIAAKDYILAEFDYNQHELRVMAEIANDDILKQALLSDVHIATASSILGKPPELVTDDERSKVGKTFNFGLIYGMSEYGIQRRLGCTIKEAEHFLKKFFANYRGVAKYMDHTREFVMQNEYVETLTGRRRRFTIPPRPMGNPASKEIQKAIWEWETYVSEVVRQAINMPVQGTAGDILLYSLIGISKYLEGKLSYLSWEVHDSVGLQIHNSEIGILYDIREIMLCYFKQYLDFEMPLAVDIKVGQDWGSMEEYK